MARVLIRTQAWGSVTNAAGLALPNLSYVLKNTDGSAATHWSAETGGSSSSSTLTTDADGGAVLSGADRWIEAGEYDLTVNGKTYRVHTGGVPGWTFVATKADAIQAGGGAITSGQNTLAITGGFVSGDVGKFVMVPGAGPSGAGAPGPFTAYIASVTGGVATLVTTNGGGTPANASNTVTNGTVTYGTGCSDAVSSALATGQRAHLPAGSYIWDKAIVPANLNLSGDGLGRTIVYFPSNINCITVTGTGLVGATGALTANAVAGAQSLAVGGGVPAGISPGDFIYLSSSTVFDAVETFCTLGEFCRVYGISGTTVYLNSPLTGPFTYTTAATAKIQKVTFLNGVRARDIEWVNGTPEQLTSGPATPATTVVNAGNGNVIQIKRALFPLVRDMKVTGWTGDFIGFTNCLHFRTENIDAKDGAQVPNAPSGNSYGYTISAYGSMWGEIKSGSIEMCHGYFNAEGTGQVAGDIVMPTSQVEVRDAVSRNGIGEPYLCHNASAFIDFVGCKVIGGPLFPTENSHNSGFQLVGHYCRAIDPIVTGASGRPIQLGNDHCEVIRPVVRNLAPWNDRCDAINVTGTNCRVVSADIDGVPNDPTLSSGRGIFVQPGATGFQMSGQSTIRNTASDAVFISDTSNTETIDGLLGINNGRYVIETLGTSPQGLWARVRGVNFTTGLTNAATGLLATPAVANYQLIIANGTFTVPAGITKLRVRAVGGGGGGGGGGSATTGIAQTGGGGGAGGSIMDQEFTVAAGNTITITIGAAGTSGSLGAAAGNPGGAGGAGGTTIVVNTTAGPTLMQAKGGTGGAGSAASSTASVGAAVWGSSGVSASGAGVNGAGSGGGSGGTSAYPNVCVVGGSGGGPATATLGGGAGQAQLSSAFIAAQAGGTSGASGTTSGITGVTATQPGCGGGGGGGGTLNTGAGGAGGAGAAGQVEIWW